MEIRDIEVGKTYANKRGHLRTVVGMRFPFVEFKTPTKPRHIQGVWIDKFAKWADCEAVTSAQTALTNEKA